MSVAIRSSSHRRRVRSKYLLLDNFSGNQLDSGLWTPPDTESKISVSGGNLVFSGGKATPAFNDPWLPGSKYYARQIGLTVEWQFRATSGNGWLVGFADSDGNQFGPGALAAWYGGFQPAINGVAWGPVLPITPALSTSYVLKVVCKAVGYLWYLSRDGGITYPLIWHNDTDATALLRSSVMSYDAALTDSFCKVYYGYAKPAVLSASPSAPALTPGDELITNGNMETGNPPSSWTAVNATLSGQADERTGGAGAQCLQVANSGVNYGESNQFITTVVGTWYRLTGWYKNGTASGRLRINTSAGTTLQQSVNQSGANWGQDTLTARATATSVGPVCKVTSSNTDGVTVRFDDLIFKALPFDQTGVLEYIGDAGVKLGVAKANITVAATYHAGFVICADSATAPTNSIWTYYDRTAGKAYLMKNTDELVAATVAYSAAAELRVVIIGPVTAAYLGLYYGGVLQGAIQGPYDLSAYGTHCHSFQTGASDTVASFTFDTGVGA